MAKREPLYPHVPKGKEVQFPHGFAHRVLDEIEHPEKRGIRRPLYPHVPKSTKAFEEPKEQFKGIPIEKFPPAYRLQPRMKAYYTPERIKEMVDFANTYARVPKAGHTIVDVDVAETLIHYPFVAFIQDDGEIIRTEWF